MTAIKDLGKIEELYHTKLKRTIQDVYAHARNIHVALYGSIIIKIFDAEAIIITFLILISYILIYVFLSWKIIQYIVYKIYINYNTVYIL